MLTFSELGLGLQKKKFDFRMAAPNAFALVLLTAEVAAAARDAVRRRREEGRQRRAAGAGGGAAADPTHDARRWRAQWGNRPR